MPTICVVFCFVLKKKGWPEKHLNQGKMLKARVEEDFQLLGSQTFPHYKNTFMW